MVICYIHCESRICDFESNVWTITGWIAMKFGIDIHVPLRMNSNHLGDPLTIHL